MTITLRRHLILVQGYTFSPLRLSLATRNLKESAEIEFNGTHQQLAMRIGFPPHQIQW